MLPGCKYDLPWRGGGGRGFASQSLYMKSLMLRSSRAFLGGGGFLGLWAAPGDICGDSSLLVKAASLFVPSRDSLQKSERYRCSRSSSRREAWPHHGHHGSSRCSRLQGDQRRKRESRIKTRALRRALRWALRRALACDGGGGGGVGCVEGHLVGSLSIICQ